MSCRSTFTRNLILLLWLLASPLPLSALQENNHQRLIEALQRGGYNLYFRHEATDWSQQDLVLQRDDWLSCNGSRIRQLSEQGRQRASRTGKAMRSLRIPVSEVLASPYCRTMETARLLGLGDVRASTAVMNLRVAEYFGGAEAIIAKARQLLARQPVEGGNRVIVAHGNVAREATPVYPDEGEMVIFKPDGEGHFVLVGQIKAEHWFQLSREKGAD